MKLQCDIYKTDVKNSGNGETATFFLEAEPSDTVLDVLIQLYQEQDPSLAFRYSCGVARCGECALLVNGEPCMACDRMVEPYLKIEPLNKIPVIRDLAVDRRHIYSQIRRMLPPVSDFEDIPGHLKAMAPEEAHVRIENSIRLTNCFECMICQSCCPRFVADEDCFPGPLGLLLLAQMQENPAQTPLAPAAVEKLGEYCLRCGRCLRFCPASENPLALGLSLLKCAPKKQVRLSVGRSGTVEIQENTQS
jgi:succinate dehydrogenase/fumarate reductase iron-sulfur protein